MNKKDGQLDLSAHLEMMAKSYDYPYFKSPCSVIVAGPSQCGETMFTQHLLRSASRAFDGPIRRIVYCYGDPQGCFSDMQLEGIHFHKGIPKNIRSLFPKNLRPGILMLDNLMLHFSEDQQVLDFFTKGSHHNDVTCIYRRKNCFRLGNSPGSFHYVVAYKNPRDFVGVRNLAQKAYTRRVPFVMDCFQIVTSQLYVYLLFDLHPSTSDLLRLRTNVLTHPTIVYQENKNEEQ